MLVELSIQPNMQRGKVLVLGTSDLSGFAAPLMSMGFEVMEVTTPAEAALAALKWRPDIGVMASNQEVEFEEILEELRAEFPVLELEELIGIREDLATKSKELHSNGNGNGNGNGHGNGHSNGHAHESQAADNQPVTLGRITEQDLAEALDSAIQAGTQPAITHFYTKIGNKLRRVNVEDIRYIEVEGKYSAIYVAERKFNVKASLKDLLAKLPFEGFVRVSRNFVINIEHIDHIDTFQYTIRIGEQEIPISRTYKENLMRHIQML
jgi:DNA-binding LytR/AlgR family response regulator